MDKEKENKLTEEELEKISGGNWLGVSDEEDGKVGWRTIVDRKLLKKLAAAKTPNDIQIIAKEYDVELSDEDAEKVFAALRQNAGEMSEEELEDAVGGFSFSSLLSKAKSLSKSAWQKYDSSIQDRMRVFLEKVEPTDA